MRTIKYSYDELTGLEDKDLVQNVRICNELVHEGGMEDVKKIFGLRR